MCNEERTGLDGTALKRREFLAGLAVFTGALGCAHESELARPARAPSGDEWARVRSEFLLAPDWVHLAGFLLASHPRPVRDAIERYRAALDHNPALYLEHDPTPRVLASAAAYLGGGDATELFPEVS